MRTIFQSLFAHPPIEPILDIIRPPIEPFSPDLGPPPELK